MSPGPTAPAALLAVDRLTTVFDANGRALPAVDQVSFLIGRGETLGLVGESGSGKSVTALSIMRLVEAPGRIASGSIQLRGRELLTLGEREMREVRGGDIALIFQEPMTALNPVFSVGSQIAEALLVHKRVSRRQSRLAVVELLESVRIPEPDRRYDDYPHQLSGGLRQRVMIAMALACRPALLIADEPTTALDATLQAQILDLLRDLKTRYELSLLLITHDLGAAARRRRAAAYCDLVEPTSGEVRFRGENVLAYSTTRMRRARRDTQMVFQDPYSSLNPRMRAGAIVEESLIIHKMGTRPERRARVAELFRLVGLDPAHLTRYPHEFSGGQRQRIGLARALALNPSLIIADEPVSALDVSIQAQVVNLLMELQQQLQLTYLFVAHDLRLVQHICDRVAVMYLGKIVEQAPASALFENPRHPYTQALLSAIPVPDPDARHVRIAVDPERFDRSAPLRELTPGHWAAV